MTHGSPSTVALLSVAQAAAVGAGGLMEHFDAGVASALLLQFGGLVWWGRGVQERQKAERDARLESERVFRDERVAAQARIHDEIAAVDQRLAAVERHATSDLERLAAAIGRLTDLAEETNRRLSTVEGLCSARHALGGRGQAI